MVEECVFSFAESQIHIAQIRYIKDKYTLLKLICLYSAQK